MDLPTYIGIFPSFPTLQFEGRVSQKGCHQRKGVRHHLAISFRYAFDKSGEKNLSELKYLNFRNFQDMMQPACQFLDGIDGCIEEYYANRHSPQ